MAEFASDIVRVSIVAFGDGDSGGGELCEELGEGMAEFASDFVRVCIAAFADGGLAFVGGEFWGSSNLSTSVPTSAAGGLVAVFVGNFLGQSRRATSSSSSQFHDFQPPQDELLQP